MRLPPIVRARCTRRISTLVYGSRRFGAPKRSCALDAENAPAEGEISAALTGTTFNWVDNLANLRVVAHTTTSPIVIVQGYAAPNDGGDNDGTIIRPNNVGSGSPGRWKRLYSGPVNVRWFGAGLGLGSGNGSIVPGLPPDRANQWVRTTRQ